MEKEFTDYKDLHLYIQERCKDIKEFVEIKNVINLFVHGKYQWNWLPFKAKIIIIEYERHYESIIGEPFSFKGGEECARLKKVQSVVWKMMVRGKGRGWMKRIVGALKNHNCKKNPSPKLIKINLLNL